MGNGTALLVTICLLHQPTVTAPESVTVAPGDLAAVRVTWAGKAIQYQASPGLNVFREYDPDPSVLLLRCMSSKPGEYLIQYVACQGDKMTGFVTTRVKVGTAPQPPPVEPEPPETPVAGAITVIVVEDSLAVRSPQTAKVLTDKAMWDEVKRKGNAWRIIPSADPICKSKGYCQLAEATGMPSLLFVQQDRVINARKLPATSDGVLNALKEYQP